MSLLDIFFDAAYPYKLKSNISIIERMEVRKGIEAVLQKYADPDIIKPIARSHYVAQPNAVFGASELDLIYRSIKSNSPARLYSMDFSNYVCNAAHSLGSFSKYNESSFFKKNPSRSKMREVRSEVDVFVGKKVSEFEDDIIDRALRVFSVHVENLKRKHEQREFELMREATPNISKKSSNPDDDTTWVHGDKIFVRNLDYHGWQAMTFNRINLDGGYRYAVQENSCLYAKARLATPELMPSWQAIKDLG